MKSINIALIGCGEIAQNFHLPVIRNLPGIRLVAIHDRVGSRAAAIAGKFDVPYVCETIDELLEIDEIEAVDICTPTHTHKEVSLAALEAGKHVFIEKPIARNHQEAKAIHAAAEKSGKKVMVGMNQRFRSDTMMMKNYVQMGEIGSVFYAKAGWIQQTEKRWRQDPRLSGGGVLMDLGLSIIDSLLWIYDFVPVASVEAAIFNRQTREVEDVAVAMMRFRDGSIATVETSWALFSAATRFYCDVYGSEGSVRVNPLELYRSEGGLSHPHKSLGLKNKYIIHQKSFENELKHFINALQGLGPIISTTGEAVESMRIIDALYRSARDGGCVTLD
ncbi:MAG: Gfo/Idh/MocA family protein [Candidatus Kapaibacterium sp.]